jgi:MFS family permease
VTQAQDQGVDTGLDTLRPDPPTESMPEQTSESVSAAESAPAPVSGGALRRGFAWFGINAAFGRFWLGQALGEVAERSIALLFPLVAVVTLHASTAQVGLVNAAQYVPMLLFSLYAGGWLAGRSRRSVLITVNILSAVLLAAVPAADDMGMMRMDLLYPLVFAIGAATCFGDVATFAFTPELVGPQQLMAANSRLESTTSIATVAAPGLGGLLLGRFGGNASLTACAAAYLVAGLAMASIRRLSTGSKIGVDTRRGQGTMARIRQGVRFAWRVPLLRVINLLAAWYNLFEQAVLTLYVVYAVRTLGFSAGLLGLTMTIGGIGPVLGPLVAGRLGRRLGAVRTMAVSLGLASLGPLLIPLAQGSRAWVFGVCAFAFTVYGFGLTVFNIFIVTAQQRTTPDRLLPQVMATRRFAAYGTIGIGAAAGGAAGEWLGLRESMFIAVGALVLGWLVFSVALLRSGTDGVGGPHEVPSRALLTAMRGRHRGERRRRLRDV